MQGPKVTLTTGPDCRGDTDAAGGEGVHQGQAVADTALCIELWVRGHMRTVRKSLFNPVTVR